MPARPKSPPPETFEQAIQRLDALVAKLEEDQLPLEEMLAAYEEGVSLARLCGEKLEAAEQKVRLIMKQNGGRANLEDFHDGEEK